MTINHDVSSESGLEIATDTVANTTNIFSLATKNSGLVAKVATRFLYILDLLLSQQQYAPEMNQRQSR